MRVLLGMMLIGLCLFVTFSFAIGVSQALLAMFIITIFFVGVILIASSN